MFPFDAHRPLPVLKGPCFLVSGGLQIDGSEIAGIDAAEIESACDMIDKEARPSCVSACRNRHRSKRKTTLTGHPRCCDHLGFCPY